jgi:hypothetical protein
MAYLPFEIKRKPPRPYPTPTFPRFIPDYAPPSDNTNVASDTVVVDDPDPLMTPTIKEGGVDPAILAGINQPTPRPTREPIAPAPTIEEPVPSVTYEDGRPVSVEGPDRLENLRALRRSTEDYIPQKAGGWRRWMQVGEGAAAAGHRGNPWEMAGGAIVGLVRSIFDRKGPDRIWKRRRQEEIDKEIDTEYGQRYKDAHIDAMRSNIEGKPQTSQSKALAEYLRLEKFDPNDPNDAGLKAYFESRGLRNLPKRSKQYRPDIRLVGGQLTVTDTSIGTAGQSKPATNASGQVITDPSKTPNQSVTIGDTVYSHLTPREAAILQGRVYQGEENRKTRKEEGRLNRDNQRYIAKQSQSGQDRRNQARIKAAAQRQGVLNASTRGAIIAVSRFRELTTQIARAEEYGQTETAAALRSQRDGHERTMRAVYGDMLKDDEAGKPTVINEEFLNPADDDDDPESTEGEQAATSPSDTDLTGQTRSISQWRRKYPNATPQQEAAWRKNVENAGGKVIK